MNDAGENLAAIGFATTHREPVCWRHIRLDPPRPKQRHEPACSVELLRWRRILARDDRPSPYRITRIAG